MRVAWDHAKSLANERKHGVSFEEAGELFRPGVDYLEIFDDEHSVTEDRFLAIGPIRRGLVLIVWTERDEETIASSAPAGRRSASRSSTKPTWMNGND